MDIGFTKLSYSFVLKSIRKKRTMKNTILLLIILFGIQGITAQSEEALIKETLNKYINGSTGGQPNLLKEAFHPDLNLYYVKNNNVAVWSGTAYIADTKEGKPTGESGKILSIDFTNNAAVAK